MAISSGPIRYPVGVQAVLFTGSGSGKAVLRSCKGPLCKGGLRCLGPGVVCSDLGKTEGVALCTGVCHPGNMLVTGGGSPGKCACGRNVCAPTIKTSGGISCLAD